MSKKKIIIGGVVLILLLVILAASIFTGGSDDAAPPETGVRRRVYVTAEDQTQRDSLLAILKGLENIKLDGQVFDRAAYKSLIDFSVPLLPQPTGRFNPFAPINPFEDLNSLPDQNSSAARTTVPVPPNTTR